jgi:predicted kinase
MQDGTSSNLRQRLVVLVGLPASGKSTWLAQRGITPLSSDAMRVLLADDVTDQTIHDLVFMSLRFLIRMRLRAGRPVTYVDATHLTPAERLPYLKIGRKCGCDVEAVFFDVPVEVCKERNRKRDRIVPDDVIDLMAAKLIPPTVEEGFSRVSRVDGSLNS